LNHRFITLIIILLLAFVGLSACNGKQVSDGEQAQVVPPGVTSTVTPTKIPQRVPIRWLVGLDGGANPIQVEIQEVVVASFNASQDRIKLSLEIVSPDTAGEVLATQIAEGNAPDIIGPISMGRANAFPDQWLDINPLISATNYDTSVFNAAHLRFYQTEAGLFALPFAIYPSGLYYQENMFDEAGLNYPPQNLGDPYIWVDGTPVDWDWDTLARVARMLTKDSSGVRANESGFSTDTITQIGYHPQWTHPNIVGSFWSPGQIYNTETLTPTAVIPEPWKDSWYWWFDGMWGEQPFMANGDIAASSEFGRGNLFNSGKVAMSLTQLWYLCCLQDAGNSWDIAAFPSHEGMVNGRLGELTFRMWKGTKNPDAAFEVLIYLTGPSGVKPLLLGNEAHPGGAYDALPALVEFQSAYIDILAERFPHVENWDIFLQSQNYPDIPSAESWMPNFEQSWNRIGAFQTLIENNREIDLNAEIQILETDLDAIFRGESGD